MARAYLIGGTPRCGKTSIALDTVKIHPMFSTSTDSLRYILRGLLSADDYPDLFAASEKFTEEAIVALCSTGHAYEIVEWQNKESAVVWDAVKRCIEGFISEDLDILIEGVAIMPEFLSQLSCDYSAVFVGNSNPEHGKIMLDYARSGSYDWMRDFKDETILQFAEFTKKFSIYLHDESLKNGYKYFDMYTDDYARIKAAAVDELLTAYNI
jgi:2-phosphoglycerate kinase